MQPDSHGKNWQAISENDEVLRRVAREIRSYHHNYKYQYTPMGSDSTRRLGQKVSL